MDPLHYPAPVPQVPCQIYHVPPGPLIPFPNPFISPLVSYHLNPHYPPPPPLPLSTQIIASPCLLISWRPSGPLINDVFNLVNPHFLLLILHQITLTLGSRLDHILLEFTKTYYLYPSLELSLRPTMMQASWC